MITLGASDADTAGMSIISTTSLAPNQGQVGTMYDPAKLACGDLRHVHSLPDGRYLTAFGTSWSAATPDNAGGYAAHTTVNTPRAFRVNPASSGSLLQLDALADTMALVGGVSDGTNVYYLVVKDGLPALVAYDTAVQGAVVRFATVALPNTNGIVWYSGIGIHSGQILIFGVNAQSELHVMALPLDAPALSAGWRYGNGKGWVSNPAELSPLVSGASGAPITTVGAVSLAQARTTVALSTCAQVGTTVYGQVWLGTHSIFTPWEPQSTALALGDTTAGTFLGSGMVFQQSLHANPDHTLMDSPLIGYGVPYCYTVGATNGLFTKWGVWPIRRIGS